MAAKLNISLSDNSAYILRFLRGDSIGARHRMMQGWGRPKDAQKGGTSFDETASGRISTWKETIAAISCVLPIDLSGSWTPPDNPHCERCSWHIFQRKLCPDTGKSPSRVDGESTWWISWSPGPVYLPSLYPWYRPWKKVLRGGTTWPSLLFLLEFLRETIPFSCMGLKPSDHAL